MTSAFSDTHNDGSESCRQSLGGRPDKAEVTTEVCAWLQIGRLSWERAGASMRTLSCFKGNARDELKQAWAHSAALNIEQIVESYWNLCTLIKTGRLTMERDLHFRKYDDNYKEFLKQTDPEKLEEMRNAYIELDYSTPQKPCTLSDLEALHSKTIAPIPEEMTPEWFQTVFKALADNSEQPIDFTWASRYKLRLPERLSVGVVDSTCNSVLSSAPSGTDRAVRNLLRARLEEHGSFPKWQASLKSVASSCGNDTALASGASTSDTPLPMPAHVTTILKFMEQPLVLPEDPTEEMRSPLEPLRQDAAGEEEAWRESKPGDQASV